MAVSKIDNGLQDQINDLNSKLFKKSYISSGNLNDYTNLGAYTVGSPSNITNMPSGAEYGVLLVFRTSIYVQQIYIDQAGRTYVRLYTGSSWASWVKIA